MTRYADPVFPSVFIDHQGDLREFDGALVAALNSWGLSLKAILEKGISLADNVDADVVAFTSNATPNTEDEVSHSLGKVPIYFLVGDLDKAGVVYRSSTAWTKSKIYVKTSVASAAVKLILL